MSEKEKITVCVVDDHSVVRQGVRTFLDMQPDITVIAEAESGAKAVEICGELAPDVVLLDLIMPEMDGVETTRGIKAISPRTQVVILTSFDENQYILPAIQAGAISYILKDASPDDLVVAVRKSANGEAVLHPRIASQIMHGLRTSEPKDLDELTQREHEVLQQIANGLSNADIAAKLFISEKTVKSHVSNILSKLHLADRTQAAVYAWRSGIVDL